MSATVRLTRKEVPKCPVKRVIGDCVDVGRERWRWDKQGKLSVYIEYGPEPMSEWVRFWTDGT